MAAIHLVLDLTLIVCAGFVFHRISVEHASFGYSRVWVKPPWANWHRAELAMSTRGVLFVIDGPTQDTSPPR